MRILITDTFHFKNKEALIDMFNHCNVDYHFGSESDIPNYDVIYSPNNPIDTSQHPNKKFIFGPHFSIFPNQKLTGIRNIHKNSIYFRLRFHPVFSFISGCIFA